MRNATVQENRACLAVYIAIGEVCTCPDNREGNNFCVRHVMHAVVDVLWWMLLWVQHMHMMTRVFFCSYSHMLGAIHVSLVGSQLQTVCGS